MEDDTPVLLATTGLVFTFGMALGATALPQTTAASICTVGLLSLDLLTNRPPEPFERVSLAWEDLGKALEDYHSEVEKLVGKVDEAWEGKGADAFITYMNETFLPPVKVLAESCETAKTTCDSIAKGFQSGLEFYFDSTCACMIAMVVSNGLMAIPKVGWMLAEAAKSLIALGEIGLHINNAVNICSSVKSDVNLSADLSLAANDLFLAFSGEGDRIDKGMLKKEYEPTESVVEDAEKWNKE